jgi:hypothetical protein
MEKWIHGDMETWKHGYGDREAWTWRHGDVDMETYTWDMEK